MKMLFDEVWDWFFSDEYPNCIISGKYLFFSEDRYKLIAIAQNEIRNHRFHEAKVSKKLLGSNTDYVLCLYYENDSRKYELAERNKQEYSVKYRYWKSDEATLRGHYSQEFLAKLSKKDRSYYKP